MLNALLCIMAKFVISNEEKKENKDKKNVTKRNQI